jgi:hypothetical protein
MLFVEMVKVEDGSLWRSGRIGSMSEVEFTCFGRLVMGRTKDGIWNIVGSEEPTAWWS